ncbi:unnamed protein product [Periconia digitata]|uniref:Uncharacterized protein n=1 Tax=Periconia digitata TaxID=1303443 RepID=A0A9W4XNV9_9PLEO|nr:unnamed protein product [Periconia digitata]
MAFMSTSAPFSSPSQRSISAALQNAPTGFAIPFPAISGALPWIGSNILGFFLVGSRLLLGAIPILPLSAAARSDRISACKLVATMVSRLFGSSVIRTVIASTNILSVSTSGYSLATSQKILSQNTIPCRCAFDLVTIVSFLRGLSFAVRNAKCMMRSTAALVNTETSVAIACGSSSCEIPPCPEYSPSLFSLTITQSISPTFTPSNGLLVPSSILVGLTLTYWFSVLRIGRIRPHKLTWSGTFGHPTAPK